MRAPPRYVHFFRISSRTAPGKCASLLQALSVALKSFVKPVRQRLAAVQGTPRATLRAFTSMLAATTSCCVEMAALFPETEPRVLLSLTHPLLQPFESFISDYSRMEASALAQEVRECLQAIDIGICMEPPLQGPFCGVVCCKVYGDNSRDYCDHFVNRLKLSLTNWKHYFDRQILFWHYFVAWYIAMWGCSSVTALLFLLVY
jgi:hypothetical protein